MFTKISKATVTAALSLGSAGSLQAQTLVENFYRNNTVQILVGYSAGRGYYTLLSVSIY